MIKGRLILISLSLLIFLAGNIEAENTQARNLLLEKHNKSKELHIILKNILYPDKETKKGINEFYNSIGNLQTSKNLESNEILIDLLDFYIGEAPNGTIKETIVNKGKSILPPLRKKLLAPSVPDEMPNEIDLEKIKDERNSEIVNLMELIYYGIRYANENNENTPINLTRLKLFMIQKCLEKVFYKSGFYPSNLGYLSDQCNYPTDISIDGWKRPLKYLSGKSFYFLISLGADGKDNSGDEIYPPIQAELHLFP